MIVIIDYGMGNVGSVKNALGALGHEAVISASPDDIRSASHLILPGVGAFPDGMKNLTDSGLVTVLSQEVVEKKKPILGVCLGMQLFAGQGEEGGMHTGLGWIPGVTRRFRVDGTRYKIPHVGWNDVSVRTQSRLFRGIARPIFYFVHSYHLVPEDSTIISGESEYGEYFAAAVEQDNIFGVQFHPEKSQYAGLKVLENFLLL